MVYRILNIFLLNVVIVVITTIKVHVYAFAHTIFHRLIKKRQLNKVVEPRPRLSSVCLQRPFVVVLIQYPIVASFIEGGFCPAEVSHYLREQSRIVFKRNSQDFILQMVLEKDN